MNNTVIRYGVIGGLLCIGGGLLNWFYFAPAYSPATIQALGYLAAILALLTVPLGIKYFRDKLNQGAVTFIQGFKIGIGISFIASFLVLCYSILFFEIAGEDYLRWSTKDLSESELREFNLRIEEMPDFMLLPWFQGLVVFLSVLLIGVIISLLSALFLQRPVNKINQTTQNHANTGIS